MTGEGSNATRWTRLAHDVLSTQARPLWRPGSPAPDRDGFPALGPVERPTESGELAGAIASVRCGAWFTIVAEDERPWGPRGRPRDETYAQRYSGP